MNNYNIKFYYKQNLVGLNSLMASISLIELNTTYSNLVEVVGAIKVIFELYSPIMVESVAVYKNGIPFKNYLRGELNEK